MIPPRDLVDLVFDPGGSIYSILVKLNYNSVYFIHKWLESGPLVRVEYTISYSSLLYAEGAE